jgi:[ribosomal protein S5]-alanine N-acetyltransferase
MSAGNSSVENRTRRRAHPRPRPATKALSVALVTLPSGRTIDLHRSRWDGVLDEEEYSFCRQHGIAVGYDCAQLGWVPLTVEDEFADHDELTEDIRDWTLKSPSPASKTEATSHTIEAELRALELRRQLDTESRSLQTEVSERRVALDAALERLNSMMTTALQRFAAEYGLSDCDLCYWGLRTVVVDFVRAVQGPRQLRPREAALAELNFRPWTTNDAEVYVKLLGNPRVWRYLPEPFPADFTIETARTLIEVGTIGFHHDTVAIEVAGRPIGQCLLRFDRTFAGKRSSEVAYWLGEEHWGQGWMSRVLPEFTDRCFRQHAVDVIYAWIMEDNKASIRVAEAAGYRREPFALEKQIAESIRRPGFIRFATYRADWLLDAHPPS